MIDGWIHSFPPKLLLHSFFLYCGHHQEEAALTVVSTPKGRQIGIDTSGENLVILHAAPSLTLSDKNVTARLLAFR
jgi:hypothetical protein